MVNHGQLFWRMKNDIDSCMMSDGEGSWQRTIGANHDWLCWRIVINCQSQPGLARGFGPRVCWGWPFLFLASSSHLYPPPFSPSVLQLGVFALWSARQRQMKRNCLGLSGLIFCCAGVPVSMCVCVCACLCSADRPPQRLSAENKIAKGQDRAQNSIKTHYFSIIFGIGQ